MFIVYQPLLLSEATKYHIEDSNHAEKEPWLTHSTKKYFFSFVAFFRMTATSALNERWRRQHSLELKYSWLKLIRFNRSQRFFMASFLFSFFDWLSSIYGIWRKKRERRGKCMRWNMKKIFFLLRLFIVESLTFHYHSTQPRKPV